MKLPSALLVLMFIDLFLPVSSFPLNLDWELILQYLYVSSQQKKLILLCWNISYQAFMSQKKKKNSVQVNEVIFNR